MEFSKRKKAKMREARKRRVNRNCRNMIGMCIDLHSKLLVIDQAKVKGVHYLLVENDDSKYSIYKIASVHEYVKLSPKKILEKRKAFKNPEYWRRSSAVKITDQGRIESVQKAPATQYKAEGNIMLIFA